MSKPWLPLVLSIAGFAAPAAAAPGASCPYPPSVTSESGVTANVGYSLDSGTQTGHPAKSSVLKAYMEPIGYNAEADSALSIDVQYFTSITHIGGFTKDPSGGGGESTGYVFDCLTFGGYPGSGQAHIPIELSGSAFVSWASSGIYVPANIFDPAYARIMISCSAYSFGTSTPGACYDRDFIFDTSQTIDTTAELVISFNFGDPVTIQFGPRVNAGYSYVHGTADELQFMVDLQVQGQLLPMYVTDFGGNPLPNVTLSATSGFDYLHPVPEPDAPAGAVAAFAVLVALRRLVRASR